MKKWNRIGNNFYPAIEATLFDFPKTGVFRVTEEKTPTGTVIGLQKICDKFEFDYKLYDLGTEEVENRIKSTWSSDLYKKTGKNLGIIYNGVKGTGKTVGAKILCNDFCDMPTLVVSQYFKGISDFIQSIDFPCVVFIDEAEKIFDNTDSECSVELLRMIDGIYSAARKVFILTTNSLSLNENLIDRPSRIRYVKEFGNVSNKAIEEIIEDKLIDKSMKTDLLSEIEKLTFSTIDIIENLIFEFNIHGSVINGDVFNIPQKSYRKLYLMIDLKTYVDHKVSLVEFEDVIELSRKLSDSNKLSLVKKGTYVPAVKILDNKIIKDDQITFKDYILTQLIKKADLGYSDSEIENREIYFYEDTVAVTSLETWSNELFEELVLDNGDKIIKINSGCFKAIRNEDPDDVYYGILL